MEASTTNTGGEQAHAESIRAERRRQQRDKSRLAPDAAQLERFARGMFAHATAGGSVSLRAFLDGDSDAVFKIETVVINGSLDPVIEKAVTLAADCAAFSQPVVFCPPLATFTGRKASEATLREGLTLSVECDASPTIARSSLTALLGKPTFTVASGGEWTDPETGETHAKLHLHWRLKEPTTTPAEHARLKRARALACDLVGGDATSKAVVHPIRWPGSWHRKGEPRLARIIEENDTEIDLNATLDELEGLAALHRHANGSEHQSEPDQTTLDAATLLACAELIINASQTDWAAWNRIGMAFHRASDGTEAGFTAFDTFSKKNPKKYNAETTCARWKHYKKSPPSKIGAGTLVYEARKADPDFLSAADVEPPPRPEFEAPPFPTAAMPAPWCELVALWEPWTEAHPASIVLPALIILGVACGQGVRLGKHRTIEYLAIVGPNATGRKDTGVDIATEFCALIDDSLIPTRGSAGSGEGVWNLMRDAGIDAKGRLLPGVEDTRLVLIDKEIVATLDAGHRTGSTIVPALLRLWDDGTYKGVTKQPVTVSRGHFGMIGLAVPERFDAALNDADRRGGLLQRHLVAAVHRGTKRVAASRALSPDIDRDALQHIADAVSNRIATATHTRHWRLSDAARDAFDTAAARWTTGEQVGEERAAPHLLRLAMLYCLTTPPDPDDPQGNEPGTVAVGHIRAAEAAWSYCVQSLSLVLGAPDAIAKLEQFVRDAPAGLNRTEIHRLFGNNLKAGELDDLIRAGCDKGVFQLRRVSTRGRPAFRVRSR